MIDLRDDRDLDVHAFARLRARCGFDARPPELLAALIAGSTWVIHAHDPAAGDQLVGFMRAISDGVATAYLSSVMVDPAYRRRGIGRAMFERIARGRDAIKLVLHARHEATEFFAAVGFAPASNMIMRDRR